MSYPSNTSHSLLGFQVLGRSSGQEMYQVHTFVLCASFTIDKDFPYLGPSACLLKMSSQLLTKNMPPLCVGPFDITVTPPGFVNLRGVLPCGSPSTRQASPLTLRSVQLRKTDMVDHNIAAISNHPSKPGTPNNDTVNPVHGF